MGVRTALFYLYYAASSGNYLPTFRDTLSVPSSRVEYPKRKPGNLFYIGVYIGIYKGFLFGYATLEEGTDRLSRNVGKELTLLAAREPRTAQFSSTSRRKPVITH